MHRRSPVEGFRRWRDRFAYSTDATVLDRFIVPALTPEMRPAAASRTDRLLLTSLSGCFLLYAGLFIYRTSFVVAGERYFSLFDDAMVSMR